MSNISKAFVGGIAAIVVLSMKMMNGAEQMLLGLISGHAISVTSCSPTRHQY